ncbi:MAG: DegV family protein [Anaerolineae bacterium]|nr:DegV family protein [Anaerolineae bacterium]
MSRFAVVTDSTSNLPPDLVEKFDMSVIPCTLHWGGDSYIDGVTLDADTFYQMLQTRKDFPTTSQPSAGAFIDFFQKVAKDKGTDTILGVFVSSELSGTIPSAMQARGQLYETRPDLQIEIIDSRSVSMGLGLPVLAAQRAADGGKSVEEAIEAVKRCQEATHVIFAVNTLEFLHRGGRIGGAARLLGSALNLKPVLTIADGRIEPLEKVRSRGKSLRRVIEIAEERLEGRRPKEAGIIQADAHADLEKFKEMVRERLNPERLHTVTLSPAVGTHGGPGTLGIAFCTEDTGA